MRTALIERHARRTVRRAREARWRSARVPEALRLRRAEDDEVLRLSGVRASIPQAMVATVIATYRRPLQVVEAVESALAQSVTDHVVVVVDDGSDGGLPSLPRHERLFVLGLSTNRGSLGLVRNVGIRLTRSTYVAFLDDDNTWYPHHLDASLAAHREGADLTYTALERVRPDGSVLDVLSVPFDRGALWDRKYTDANSIVVRRTPAVRFSRHRDQAEDWELVLRLSRSMRVEHVPAATVRYLMNDRSYYHDYAELGGSGVHRTTRA